MTAPTSLMGHALADCSDPDCEIHNPIVGIEETTVSEANAAFYVAGLLAAREIAWRLREYPHSAKEEITREAKRVAVSLEDA